ncbi:uncharacterized protein [Emydura macquarii macquarii]|uniref:uncharacterized protein n=1 Tax=Emydura macquarii macquarii TaxID=1129001 RepID=UPI00352A11D5
MASSRDMWISIRSVLCCQSTKEGVLEPLRKEQPPPCASGGPVCPENGVALLQTSASPQHDGPLPPVHAAPGTRETANQNAELLYLQRIRELEEELKRSQSWNRQLSCRVNELEHLICPEVEWRNSVQPNLAEKLQLHLERSLLEKQELECRALRAEESIQDLKHEITVLQKRLQALCPSPTTPALLATARPSLPPSPPPLPSPPLQSSSIRLLFSKMHKKLAAQTPPKQGAVPSDECVSPKQNGMKEVLDTIRRGVSLRPVCMSRHYTISRAEEATSLAYEQEKPLTKQGSKSIPETDSSSTRPPSSQTPQPLGSIATVPSSGTSSDLCTSQACREEDSGPEREQEDAGRSSEADKRHDTTTSSTRPATSPLEEGSNLEEIPCGSPTSPDVDTATQIPEDSEATDCSMSPSSKSQLAVGKENTEDDGEVGTVAADEVCEGELSAGPAGEVAQALGLGDHGSVETVDLSSCKHLSLAPLVHAACPAEISPPAEDLLVGGRGQNINLIAASCMGTAIGLKPNASQALSAELMARDQSLPGTTEKQPPLCPVAAANEVETEVLLEDGDLGEPKMLPASANEPPARSCSEGEEIGASVVKDQSSALKDSTAIATAALPLPGATEAPVPAGPDTLTEAGPADSSNSKETIPGLAALEVHQEQLQEAAAQPGSDPH